MGHPGCALAEDAITRSWSRGARREAKNSAPVVINTSRNGVSWGRALIFPLFLSRAPLITYPVDGGRVLARLSRTMASSSPWTRGRVMFSDAASIALCGPRVKMCQNSSSRSRRRPQKAVRRPYKLTGRPRPASTRAARGRGSLRKARDATRLTDYPPTTCLWLLFILIFIDRFDYF